MAERNPGQPEKARIPSHLLYNEEEPFCCYCRNTHNLRVGRLPLSGVVAFCKSCKNQFKDDKEWENE